ncbi:hypothetical protein TCAL_16092 [Tigriopus californicus]|uniref:G-protein coupled receptors family 1 profile domain-containing protein n=1 Tax=Tigriopus californicus TaxID=6832 RepID=A0A553PQ11_TIGCA|nr:hypothetical protein TCAL_16092 [Tigriopus californicus]
MMDFVKHWRQWRIYSLPVLIMFSLVVVSMRRPEQGHSIPLENFIPVENADPKREIFQEMKVSQCGCSKLVPTNEIPPNPIWDQGNTTCSLDTWIRGPHQGVIGFTYFEHPAKTDKAKSRDYLQVGAYFKASATCAPDWESGYHRSYVVWLFGVGFFIPLGIILVASSLTIWKLHKISSSINEKNVRRRSIKRSSKVSVLIIWMNVVFLICWLPYGVLCFLRFIAGESSESGRFSCEF